MNSIPAELLTLKTRFDRWRATRQYDREPIPAELRQAVVDLSRTVSRAQIRNALKVDPWRLLERTSKTAPRRAVSQVTKPVFFELPADAALPKQRLPAAGIFKDCRLLLERPDGARLTLTLPNYDLETINRLCADFLQGASR